MMKLGGGWAKLRATGKQRRGGRARFKAHAWRACKLRKSFGGSNPPLSATQSVIFAYNLEKATNPRGT
jgi:hypothetical protein